MFNTKTTVEEIEQAFVRSRIQLLRSNARLWCAEHNSMQPVVDFFKIGKGVAQLECGCRRAL